MVAPPRVNLRGVVTSVDAKKMSIWTEREIGWVLENRWKQLARQTGGTSVEVDWMGLQREVEVGLARRMRRELQVEPLILCLVQPAPGGTPAYKGRADEEPDSRPITRRADTSLNGASSGASSTPLKASQSSGGNLPKTQSVSKTNGVNAKQADTQSEIPSGRTRRRRSAVAS